MSLLLAIIYLALISLGLPDSLLGSAWPSMYGQLNVPHVLRGRYLHADLRRDHRLQLNERPADQTDGGGQGDRPQRGPDGGGPVRRRERL